MDPTTTTTTSSSPKPSPATWRRSVKRKTDPPVSDTELADLRRKAEEQASEIEELRRNLEATVSSMDQLRKEKEAAESMAAAQAAAAAGLSKELEAERLASETATSEAMLMIERLQREKSAAAMEARQYRRFADSRADHDLELQNELAALTDLAASYRSRLESLGVDPEAEETDDDHESNGGDDDEPDDDNKDKEASAASSSSNTTSIEKGMVEESSDQIPLPVRRRRASGESFTSAVKVEEFPVVVSQDCDVKEYGIIVDGYGGVKDLYGRLAVLEADREEMRKEIVAMRLEKAKLLVMRVMARRLCREVAEDRSLVKKSPDFSFGALLKWIFSLLSWRRQSSKIRYTFALSSTFVGLLLLADKSIGLRPWKRLQQTRQ